MSLIPQNPHHSCDKFEAQLSIVPNLDYKKFSLITTRNNEFHGRVVDLAIKAFTTSHVLNNPLIHTGHSVRGVKIQLNLSP